jgi:hypothetical protein
LLNTCTWQGVGYAHAARYECGFILQH